MTVSLRRDLADALATWARNGLVIVHVEHTIPLGLLRHAVTVTTPPAPGQPIVGRYTVENRVVMEHPEACGCDALPDSVLLEG